MMKRRLVGRVLVAGVLVLLAGLLVVSYPSSANPSKSSQPHTVTFRQGACSPSVYAAPWSVTLGRVTVTEPKGANPSANTTESYASSNYNLATITLSVPDGEYDYSLSPRVFPIQNPGSLTVNGTDVTVNVPIEVACVNFSPFG